MAEIVRVLGRDRLTETSEAAVVREWLVSNGHGGYASATVSGMVTRRYHGLLIAALPSPLGRLVMLNHVGEEVTLPDGQRVPLVGNEPDPGERLDGSLGNLAEFRLEMGLPVWRYEMAGVVIEKRIVMPYRQNIVHITYRLVEAPGEVRLDLRPSFGFRPIEAPVDRLWGRGYAVHARGEDYEITADPEVPPLRLHITGAPTRLILDGGTRREVFYRVEMERGHDSCGPLWTPGCFSTRLAPGQAVTMVAGTENWDRIHALEPEETLAFERERRRRLVRMAHPALRQGAMAELVLAADSFIVAPVGRVVDMARARAEGDEVRTVIAGYHWFTDWGRDTMISLEGLTLVTGRAVEAAWILRTFAHYVRRGLIPNMFPEGRNDGLYHTADATLWFFHALGRYVAATGDRATLSIVLPKLKDIVEHHRRGTDFNIRVDPADGLLSQGREGYQLTWMDAKVEDWVVTPRRGKAVEINALWYNALRLLARWVAQEEGDAAARPYGELADQARDSFNRRFWYAKGNHLYDLVDGEEGDDPTLRPNQILAVALDEPVLDRERWEPVVESVRRELLTPVGLRSLAPGHRDYKAKYFGDLRARDAAYHQGTVWAWLIGPMVDAWRKLHPEDRAGARRLLEGLLPQLDEAGVGTISEIFDAEPPFVPRGCMSQAWSVAEMLRCWVATDEAGNGA